MAVRQYVMDNARQGSFTGEGDIKRVSWTGLASTTTDTGQPIAMAEWVYGTIHLGCSNLATGAASTLGTSDSMSLEGSNDYIPAAEDGGNPVNAGTWAVLKDISNTAITAAALNAIFELGQRPLWIRPHLTAGTGGTWNAVLLLVRPQPMITGG